MSRNKQPRNVPDANTAGSQAGSGVTGAGTPGGGSGAGGLGAAGTGGGRSGRHFDRRSDRGRVHRRRQRHGGDPTQGLGGITDTRRPDQEETPGAGSGLGLSKSAREGKPPEDEVKES